MSGRYEKEEKLKGMIEARLDGYPYILTEYYYSLIGAGKTYKTVNEYTKHIINFLKYTFGNQFPNDFYTKVKSIHINKYISSLRTKNVNGKIERTSDSLKTTTWSALNSFFKFLVPEYIEKNPVENTERPKMRDNPNVTYLTPDEIAKVLNSVETKANNKIKNRDLCILKLGFSTGLRVSAIAQIDMDDIDFKKNQIRVTEKGDYDSYVMFGEKLKTQLLEWIDDRDVYFSGNDTNALFISQKGNRISTDMIGKMLNKYADGVIDKHVHPHVMRHSCATNLYEKTGDIYLCSSQLHHRNVSTTQRYAELSKEKKKYAADLLDGTI